LATSDRRRGRCRARRGTKYALTPSGYDGPLLPGAYVYEQGTNYGFAILRAIIPDASEENIAKAAEFAQRIKVYPLSEADDPPAMNYVDTFDVLLEMTPVLDDSVYAEIHKIIQEEVVLERDLSMMGMLAQLGIKKGVPFEPTVEMQAVFDKAAPEALQYMIGQYHRVLNPMMYEGKK
jgi:hypothetical protein